MCIKYILFAVSLLSVAPAAADVVVPQVHQEAHKRMEKEYQDGLSFQGFSDSLTCQDGATEGDVFDLYPSLDLYADWDDEHVDPTRGKNNYVIPDSLDIYLNGWVPPIVGKINSPYGWRRRRMHRGVDIKLFVGDTIRSAFDGKVRIKKLQGIRKGYGYYLVIRHPNGFETVYGHLSKFLVERDQEVKAGQPIALGGNTGRSTGPHLHLEFRVCGIDVDPADIINFNDFTPKVNPYHFRKKIAKLISDGGAGPEGAAYHRVKPGDTLGGIARRYHTSVSRLCKLNNIRSTSTLRLGQRIRYK